MPIPPLRARHLLPLLLAPLVVSAHDHAQDPTLRASEPDAPAIASPVVVPLDASSRASLPRHAVEANAHGQTLRCEGVSLTALLQASGAMPDTPLRGPHLGRYVLVQGRDGYRALFSLAELDATLGNAQVVLADRCDGKPLDTDAGPLRLLVPGDTRPARGVRQVDSISVIVAP